MVQIRKPVRRSEDLIDRRNDTANALRAWRIMDAKLRAELDRRVAEMVKRSRRRGR